MKEVIGVMCLGFCLGFLVWFIFLAVGPPGHELQKMIVGVLTLGFFVGWNILGLGKKWEW